jgi:hypothetical protein
VKNLDHPAHPLSKDTGDHNLPEKRGQAMSANRTPRKTRVVWPRLDCLKSNPDRGMGDPVAVGFKAPWRFSSELFWVPTRLLLKYTLRPAVRMIQIDATSMESWGYVRDIVTTKTTVFLAHS